MGRFRNSRVIRLRLCPRTLGEIMDEDLRRNLDAEIERLGSRLQKVEARLSLPGERELSVIEQLRTMRYESLRGCASVEFNGDRAAADEEFLSDRVKVLESRFLEVLLRLGMTPGDTKH
jgi:hypothetical protein